MKALISPDEIVVDYQGNQGTRVAQVEQEIFEVAPPLYWVECPNDCVADIWWYYQGTCQLMPMPPPPSVTLEP
jgi:hypothetical protein